MAEVEIDAAVGRSRCLVVLTHGAGGDVDVPDLLAVRDAALAHRATVARVRQPYRVAGRRAPGSPARQDAAWLEVVAALRSMYPIEPLILAGRSNGARVACRTAAATGARGVIALSFPVHPPGKPEASRIEELRSASGVLVINGVRDPFGAPSPGDAEEVRILEGQAHSLTKGLDDIKTWVGEWIEARATVA